MLRLSVSLALLAAVISCSKDDNKETNGAAAAASESRVTANDLAAPTTNLKTINALELNSTLASHIIGGEPYALGLKKLKLKLKLLEPSAPEEGGGSEETGGNGLDSFSAALDECMYGSYDSVKGKIVGKALVYEIASDHSACIRTAAAKISGLTVTVDTISSSIYSSIECEGWDPSPYVGKPSSALEDETLSCKGTARVQSSTKTVMKFTIKTDGVTQKIDTLSVGSQSSADNQACVSTVSGAKRTVDACVNIAKEIDNVEANSNTYLKMTSDRLVQANDSNSPYFDSGSYKIQLNDWTGKVTFAGEQADPSYTLTNGTRTETGTLQQITNDTDCLTACSPAPVE
ncbi:MAG: hypothetical protein EOP07_17775 [Proteobacteria bacterium]|nr:MAG: hypothetical protein EOP07_17775 [Pseudomonadota bacterium]